MLEISRQIPEVSNREVRQNELSKLTLTNADSSTHLE